jgi:hypothetical protein
MSPTDDDDRRSLEQLLEIARADAPPAQLGERVLEHIAYRTRLEQFAGTRLAHRRVALGVAAGVAVAAAAAAFVLLRPASHEPAIIAAERAQLAGGASSRPAAAAAPASTSQPAPPVFDPCTERVVASGSAPLIDDFEDGDDAVLPLDGRSGFWRWAREIDAPGTAPALIPLPRLDAPRGNRLALHVKGGLLVDWGATVEFNFRPSCYDASKYAGISFQARGPGRIYLAPREVGVIPIAEGGTCDHDCHNPHVAKIDLESAWHVYQVRWADVRQRGAARPPLDPTRLHSIAFLIRPEDTPYDLWLDEVRFIPR